ncbi:uncharacterized protein LOC117646308 [Thrips palmi]|uniref:Uncharacterized protein LOC117646308 n=1 Tax=Thrips palmi TaxID=161013 RepID=A0A6P8YZG3_THRPL|nr:uncharacterized protein LOC117646308 [Thrips palmi]
MGVNLKQCEHRCSNTRPPCGAFSFGVHSGGNTTCELGRTSSARINQDPDFDLYVRRPECDGEPPEAPSLQRPHRLRPPQPPQPAASWADLRAQASLQEAVETSPPPGSDA